MKRRNFLKKTAGATAAGVLGAASAKAHVVQLKADRPQVEYGPNDKIRLACIGMGIISHYDIKSALNAGGSELVACADLYTGRLQRAKEVFGNQLFTTRDYREILARNDVDAVIVATPDHWHSQITIDALAAGKHVYCEKPIVHKPKEGLAVIEAEKKYGKVVEIGSQRVSSVAFAEAKKLYEQGAIGKINQVVATMNRHSSLGAWQYSIPLDASPQTVDWDAFLGKAPKIPFDATRFFRWRNYRDYGTGIPGDLFVHLITGIHYVTGALGPTRIFTAGQLSFWKDGRDVPDVVAAVMDYPQTAQHSAFQVILQVNFADGSNSDSVTKIIGTDGAIELGWNDFVLRRSKLPNAPGYGGYDSLFTFPEDTQKAFETAYKSKWSEADRKAEKVDDVVFAAPDGYDDRTDHFRNFFAGIREGKKVVEDSTFGVRAAGPCLAANESHFQQKIIKWDPVTMKMG